MKKTDYELKQYGFSGENLGHILVYNEADRKFFKNLNQIYPNFLPLLLFSRQLMCLQKNLIVFQKHHLYNLTLTFT